MLRIFSSSTAQHMDSRVDTIDTMALRTVTLWCTLIPSPGKEKIVRETCRKLILAMILTAPASGHALGFIEQSPGG